MRKRIYQSSLRVRTNRLQRFAGYFFRDLAVCAMILTATLLTTSGMIYLYTYILSDPYFRIKETIVRGCREVTEKEVLALASVQSYQNLFSVNTRQISSNVEKSPWIRKAHVGRELPDRLVMEVHEHQPLALVAKQKTLYIINREGFLFKKLDPDDDLDLPILTGSHHKGNSQSPLMKKSLELLTYLSDTRQASLSYQHLSEIHLDEIFGLSLITDTGLCLVLGHDGYEEKLRALPTVLEGLEKKNINMALLHIDLRDPSKITVQSKAKSAPEKPVAGNKGYRI